MSASTTDRIREHIERRGSDLASSVDALSDRISDLEITDHARDLAAGARASVNDVVDKARAATPDRVLDGADHVKDLLTPASHKSSGPGRGTVLLGVAAATLTVVLVAAILRRRRRPASE